MVEVAPLDGTAASHDGIVLKVSSTTPGIQTLPGQRPLSAAAMNLLRANNLVEAPAVHGVNQSKPLASIITTERAQRMNGQLQGDNVTMGDSKVTNVTGNFEGPFFFQMGSTTDVEHAGKDEQQTTGNTDQALDSGATSIGIVKMGSSTKDVGTSIGIVKPSSSKDGEHEVKVEQQTTGNADQGSNSGATPIGIVNLPPLQSTSFLELGSGHQVAGVVGQQIKDAEQANEVGGRSADFLSQGVAAESGGLPADYPSQGVHAAAVTNQPFLSQSKGADHIKDADHTKEPKDLNGRTDKTPFLLGQDPADMNRNPFLGWVKDLITIGERGAETNDLNAADSLGAAEEEANYSADTEGFWLLLCLTGLLLFSCVIMRAWPLDFCMAPRRQKDAEAKLDDKPVVPAFEAVVKSARAAEQVVLEKAGIGGLEELLSSVAQLPAESVPDLVNVPDGLRKQVQSIPSLTDNMLIMLEATQTGGYDFTLARPLSFCQVVRMQATVLQLGKSDMLAPLGQQMCVLYQVTVSRRLHSGMPPVPVAFSSMNTSFQVAPCLRPDFRVSIEGSDVMLFDTVVGQFTYQGSFAGAPGHLQDYVLTHRSAVPGGRWQTSSSLQTDATPLEFQECALLVGSQVTLVGELARDALGDLVLRPTYLALPELNGTPRVLVSDHPHWIPKLLNAPH